MWQTLLWSDCLHVWHDTLAPYAVWCACPGQSSSIDSEEENGTGRKSWKYSEKERRRHPNLTNGAICLSVFTPASAIITSANAEGPDCLHLYCLTRYFFVLMRVYFNTKKKMSEEIWVHRWNAEMLWNTISKRHSAIFQIAIDSVNQSRETFQPLWHALSKASLFLETRFSYSL